MSNDSREPFTNERFTATALINSINKLLKRHKANPDSVRIVMADGEAVCAAHYINGQIIITDRLEDDTDSKKRAARAKKILKYPSDAAFLREIGNSPKRYLVAPGNLGVAESAWVENMDSLEECAGCIENLEMIDAHDEFTVVDLDTGKKRKAAIAVRVSFE